jgi:hypothetical protein
MFRREPSRLYTLLVTFPESRYRSVELRSYRDLTSLSSALPFSKCCEGFADFDSIHVGVSIRRAQIISNSLSPLCLPFHHPGQLTRIAFEFMISIGKLQEKALRTAIKGIY